MTSSRFTEWAGKQVLNFISRILDNYIKKNMMNIERKRLESLITYFVSHCISFDDSRHVIILYIHKHLSSSSSFLIRMESVCVFFFFCSFRYDIRHIYVLRFHYFDLTSWIRKRRRKKTTKLWKMRMGICEWMQLLQPHKHSIMELKGVYLSCSCCCCCIVNGVNNCFSSVHCCLCIEIYIYNPNMPN